jgi:peptide/nickel transport system permease protein
VSTYVGRRLLLLVPTLLLTLVTTFIMLRLAPGDPADALLEEIQAGEAQHVAVHHQLGLDRPVPVQFAAYVSRVLRGDLGRSYFTREPVLEKLLSRLPFTLELALAAQAVAMAIGLPFGVLAAVRPRTWFDYAASAGAVAVHSMPRFWIGLLLMLTFAVHLEWFPVIGAGRQGDLLDQLLHLVLPVLAIALVHSGQLARTARASLLEVLRQDFVRTARGKGVPERRILLRHALPGALVPIMTIIGLGFGRLLGGAVVVETVFVRPGLGTLLAEAIRARDYPVVQGTILFFAVAIVLVNIVVDIGYAVFDPRIRL